MTSFSIGTNPTIATNGDPSYHQYNTNGVYLWVLDNPQMIIQKEAYLIDRGKTLSPDDLTRRNEHWTLSISIFIVKS